METYQISEQQLAANRANAQHCTGPTSIEGKKKSSMNALRHGVTAQTTVMTEEDRIKHDNFCARMIAELAPVGEMETFAASSAAEEAWRLNHSRAQCNNIVAIGHFDGTGDHYDTGHAEIHTAITSATVVRDKAKTLELLSLYEQRIHRAFQKHLAHLKQLQAERKAKHETDLENARLLSQVAELQRLPYIPAEDGFVFSTAQINRYTDQFHRLNFAKAQDFIYRKQASQYKSPEVICFPQQAA
jgi:hypothetical protein